MKRRELRELAEGGVLLTSRALEAGWPRRSLTRHLRGEGWVRLQTGAWAEPGAARNLVTQLRAVQLLRPQLVVSHCSAAVLWRIETLTHPSPAPLEFTDTELIHRRRDKGVRVHRIPLTGDEVAERNGLRFTTVNRTLADLLRSGPRDEALVAVESALSRRRVGRVRRAPLTSLTTLTATLDTPLQGAARARGWLDLADPRSGSPAETITRLRMYDAGLYPESQAELLTPDGRQVFLDFFFRREGLAVEIEGYAYHGTRDSHRRDMARFNRILQCPEVRSLLRYSAEDVFHRPAQIVQEIGGALRRPVGAA
ncbi:hypothetical protein QQY66_20625 [Streptomyces sp. DG2A-72]|uniref:hypothetical protein n=1 Tax=Streptomyces sp. DG2A-72 TaxID=3051386 RepID=UPI00265C8531|nr:hypothetical protein [Streptomyces sp. DG2A-72]MDO0933971.1 hypothetical protein [Streptomyces sp. DG2A-72]